MVVDRTDTLPDTAEDVTAFAHPVEREIARIFDDRDIQMLAGPWQLAALARAANGGASAQEVDGV